MKNKDKKQVETINNSNEKLLLSDVSNSVFCPNCKTSDMITVDNWCMRCGTVLKKTVC